MLTFRDISAGKAVQGSRYEHMVENTRVSSIPAINRAWDDEVPSGTVHGRRAGSAARHTSPDPSFRVFLDPGWIACHGKR